MIEVFTKHLPTGYRPKVILELGSYNGVQAIQFAQMYPEATVYAFEASPVLIKAVRYRVGDHPRIRATHAAVQDVNGPVAFHLAPLAFPRTRATSSLFKAPNVLTQQVMVPGMRLDTWLAEENIPKVDLIWSDIQGAELKMLQGLGERIREVDAMFLEVFYREVWYRGIPLASDIKQFMETSGFELKEDLVCPNEPAWGDQVWFRKKS